MAVIKNYPKALKKRKNTAKLKSLEVASQTHRAFYKSINFEDFLRNNITETEREFRLVVKEINQDSLTILVHPLGRDGETYDGYCLRFNVEPKQAIDNLMKFLREGVTTEKVPTII